MKQTKQSGFTLVELAIVLVIIGLIVGGVLVGQDLIKAAEIRNAATQIEKYNAGASAFRTKYDGLPGDLLSSRANSFGMQVPGTNPGTTGRRDGNGILEAGSAGATGVGGETDLFWRDLSFAQMIPDGFSTATGVPAAITSGNMNNHLPTMKLRDSASVHAVAMGGKNQFYIASITVADATGAITSEGDALSPIESENIDSKVDDGLPNSGILRAFDDIADAAASTMPGSTTCATAGTAAAPYVLTNSGGVNGTSIACRLRWRTSF